LTASAVDISTIKPVQKKLLLETLNLPLDNIEGLTFGPQQLADGRRSLIVVSDNNFQLLSSDIDPGIKQRKREA